MALAVMLPDFQLFNVVDAAIEGQNSLALVVIAKLAGVDAALRRRLHPAELVRLLRQGILSPIDREALRKILSSSLVARPRSGALRSCRSSSGFTHESARARPAARPTRSRDPRTARPERLRPSPSAASAPWSPPSEPPRLRLLRAPGWFRLEETYETIVTLAPQTRYYWDTGSWHLAYNASADYDENAGPPALRRRQKWTRGDRPRRRHARTRDPQQPGRLDAPQPTRPASTPIRNKILDFPEAAALVRSRDRKRGTHPTSPRPPLRPRPHPRPRGGNPGRCPAASTPRTAQPRADPELHPFRRRIPRQPRAPARGDRDRTRSSKTEEQAWNNSGSTTTATPGGSSPRMASTGPPLASRTDSRGPAGQARPPARRPLDPSHAIPRCFARQPTASRPQSLPTVRRPCESLSSVTSMPTSRPSRLSSRMPASRRAILHLPGRRRRLQCRPRPTASKGSARWTAR